MQGLGTETYITLMKTACPQVQISIRLTSPHGHKNQKKMKIINVSFEERMKIGIIKIGLMNQGWSEQEAEQEAIETILKSRATRPKGKKK